jgi:hypothetical protein
LGPSDCANGDPTAGPECASTSDIAERRRGTLGDWAEFVRGLEEYCKQGAADSARFM